MSQFTGSASRVAEAASDLIGPWFRTLALSLKSGVVLLDADGAVVYTNRAACDLLGVPPSDDEKRDLARVAKCLPEAITGASSDEEEVVIRPEDERLRTRQVSVRRVAIDTAGCGTLLLIEDRTSADALEGILTLASRVRTSRLLHSQIHDLRAPLNAISLNLEELRLELEDMGAGAAEPDGDADPTETVRLLQSEIARIARLLEAFSQQTGHENGDREHFDLRDAVRDVAELLQPVARDQGVSLALELPDARIPVHVIVDFVKQALLNLALNAVEATAERGGGVTLAVVQEGDWARILVVDDGEGIPERLVERTFERSFSTKEGGQGIGLTVARTLVHGMGGKIRLRSREGEGTTVTVELPLSDGDAS